jgi:hypothetical protein
MKFFYADSQDYIDPGYDFQEDDFSPDRRVQRDDRYPHEFFAQAPYDGLLVSRAIVGDERWRGKYSTAQALRFRREGARAFLRYDGNPIERPIIGDCGAFSYVKEARPPYSVDEMIDYYVECGFTHGVSIDHVILGYEEQSRLPGQVPDDWQYRWQLTLDLAKEFRGSCERRGAPFVPLGVAQGWSPASYAEAARRLADMGYDYIALGGMVPLQIGQILRILDAVRNLVPDWVRLHLFGFMKSDHIERLLPYRVESFDTTSPMLRSFKDARRNYMGPRRWYTAVRVPSADENRVFKQDVLAGLRVQHELREMEASALKALRDYAAGAATLDETLAPVVTYGEAFKPNVAAEAYRETLGDRAWESCPCRVCQEAGIEVMIFRGSNRNKRRGFHNLWEFHRQLRAAGHGSSADTAGNRVDYAT